MIPVSKIRTQLETENDRLDYVTMDVAGLHYFEIGWHQINNSHSLSPIGEVIELSSLILSPIGEVIELSSLIGEVVNDFIFDI